MRRITIFLTFICSTLFAVSCFAQPLIASKKSAYMPKLPPLSFTTLTSRFMRIEPYKNGRFRIFIPSKDLVNLAITRNKNPILSESIPGQYLSKFIVVNSDNSFENAPVDAQVIMDDQVQSIKIVSFNFTPKSIELIFKPFSENRKIITGKGNGIVVVNSSCITNRTVCALGCTYMIIPEPGCRKKLGIL